MKNKVFAFILAFLCLFSSFYKNIARAEILDNEIGLSSFSSLSSSDLSNYKTVTGFLSPYSDISSYTMNYYYENSITAQYAFDYGSHNDTISLSQWYDIFYARIGEQIPFEIDFFNTANYRPRIVLPNENVFISDYYTINNVFFYSGVLYIGVSYNVKFYPVDIMSAFKNGSLLEPFRYNGTINKLRTILAPNTLYYDYLESKQSFDLYDCTVPSSYVSLHFFTPQFNVNEIVWDMSLGYGDEDIYRVSPFNNVQSNFILSDTSLAGFNSINTPIIKTVLDSNYLVDSYKFSFLLPSVTFPNSSSLLDYGAQIIFYFNYFNVFPFENNLVVSSSSNSPNYTNCEWYDLPCQIGNALSYIVYEFPLTKPIYTFFKSVFSLISPIFDFFKLFVDIPYFSAILFLFFFVALLFFLIR